MLFRSGIIAAQKDNGIGGFGVHTKAEILSIDVFDRGWGASDYAIAEGILEAVRSGAKVINMSLAGPMPSPVIEEAVKHAVAKNVVIVAAAGNEASDWTNYPAGYEGVISVGSTNKYKNYLVTHLLGHRLILWLQGKMYIAQSMNLRSYRASAR